MHIRLLSANEFPPLLNEIPDKPNKLYIRGEMPDYSKYKFLSVVGSRKQSEYGKIVTDKLISGLLGQPIVIISGLALGTDAYAHECALKVGLKTIAVPGSGLNDKVIYPATNLSLAKKILEKGGALVSEFEPDLKAAPYTFPQRNRIMAGMSHATLIIECTLQSGTLITARLAMEYNRDVLTVPGSILEENRKGPHSLIRNGATIIEESRDILDVLGLINTDVISDNPDLSLDEIKILECLTEPISKDDLLEVLDLDISKFNMLISSLEIKGLIKETLGKITKI